MPGVRLLPRLFRILPKPRPPPLLGAGLVLPQWVVSFDFLGREMRHANTYKGSVVFDPKQFKGASERAFLLKVCVNRC